MMKRKWLVLAAIAVVLTAGVFALLPRAESQGVFYRVSGGKSEMVILGSIHIGSKDMYPFNQQIQTALTNADVLVFECDTQSEASLADTQRLMQYAQGESISDFISQEGLAQLEKAAQKLGYNMESLLRLKPWAIVSMFSMETLSSAMGVRSTESAVALGVENRVRQQGGNKPKLYLETVSEQLGRMDAFSPALQEYLLADAVSAVLEPEEDKELQSWPEWWADGNADAFAQSYRRGQAEEEEPLLAREYHDSLITQRNLQMAEQLAGWLENDEGKRYFVTVGLMHLVLEEDSIFSELEARGYQVEKIEN